MRGWAMWRVICAAGLAISLSAFQSHALERGTPVRLTSDELSDIKESVAWDLKQSRAIDSDSPDRIKFGKIAGAKNSKGITSLCGYLRIKEMDGSYSNDMLFTGILSNYPSRLHNDRVLTGTLARTPESVAHTRTTCKMLGINI
ncbi:MAG: hypothetical protein K0Q60_1448 [Microvirga sp.]|jgi:hypothetical protein|nr:hypothetical protein [Microvirga sp.]